VQGPSRLWLRPGERGEHPNREKRLAGPVESGVVVIEPEVGVDARLQLAQVAVDHQGLGMLAMRANDGADVTGGWDDVIV